MIAIPTMVLDALAAALDDGLDRAIAIDVAGRVVYANRAASDRWRAGGAAVDGFPPDHARRFVDALSAILGGAPARFEFGARGPAGVRGWFVCALSPLRHGGAIVGALAIATDVTELKRVEDRLRRSEQLMVDTQDVAHMGTWEWEVSEPHAIWSLELYRIYGLSPESYVPSYEAYLEMVHPEDRQRVIDATNRVFHQHEPYSHDERIFRPDGTMRYLHTWAYPVLDDEGTLRRLVGVCQDITDRKLAEEQVHELARDLERRVAERTRTIENSMRDLEAFNATISHDLRAPLQVIQTAASLAGRTMHERPADAHVHLERIQRAVDHMTALVDALLALARVASSPLQKVDVDLSTIAAEIVADHGRLEPRRAVDVLIAPGLSCRGDASLLRAVLQNLIGNAWKYSARADRARIEVGAEGPAFFVRDNGIGFAMEDAGRLFAPFARLAAAAEFAGTGIGLATVQRILERHGGRIWAEGEPGKGATFYFQLPE